MMGMLEEQSLQFPDVRFDLQINFINLFLEHQGT